MTRQTPKPPFLALLFAATLLALAVTALFSSPLPERDFAPHDQRVTVRPPPPLFPYEEKSVPVPLPLPVTPAPVPQHKVARIALIIDDVGISNAQVAPLFTLPLKPTLSFLPYGRATPAAAARAAREGYEVMLHMPMQPVGHENPGPDAITVGLDAGDIAARLQSALASVPQAVGVNNHMGSAATSDAATMQAFMAALQPTGKFFVDSYTSAGSVAFDTARAAGVPTLRRDVFLDNDENEEATLQQLALAESLAKKHGSVIAIGHPYPSTVAALARWMTGVETRGIALVKISDLMKER